jgi:hypothetical protein
VDTDAIALKVKQEFAAKEKAKKTPQSTAKTAKSGLAIDTRRGCSSLPLFFAAQKSCRENPRWFPRAPSSRLACGPAARVDRQGRNSQKFVCRYLV